MKIQRRQLFKTILASTAGLALTKYGFAAKNELLNETMPQGEINIINSGIGGNNTIDLLNRIEKDCYAYSPQLTILMIGTNDMNSAKHVALNQYEINLTQIIKGIKSKGSKVMIMTILPPYEPYLLMRHPEVFYQPEGPSGRRKQVNEVIKKVAGKHSIHLLDMGHRFEVIGKVGLDKDSLIKNEANSNQKDGIHPTANGYRFIALAVYDYIVTNKLPQTNIVCFGDSITYGNSKDKDSYPAYLKQLLS